jgi:hypothetical protein
MKHDAAAFLDLQKTIEEETRYMMMKSGERDVAVAEQRKLLLPFSSLETT